jgi:hypothetical protein
MELYAREDSREEWRQARRSAFIQDVLGAFTQRSAELLPFEVVRQELHLRNARYLDLDDVPLDRIVGSVGRSEDFTRAFFLRHESVGCRWLTRGVDLSGTASCPI